MRVLHVISGDQWAGAEVQAFTQLTQLHRFVDLHVLVMNEGELTRRCREAGIPTSVVDEARLSAGQLFAGIRREMSRFKPQVVHTHRQKENVLGALANLASCQAKCLRTVHGASEFSPTTRQKLQIFLDRFCGRYLQDAIISVSGELAAKLERQFAKEKVYVIPNGIDPQEVRRKLQTPAFKTESPDATHIGIVGRLVTVKRVDIFLQMAALLTRKSPERSWQFHVFGDGPLRDSLHASAASLGIARRVRFHGHRTDVRSCMASLDAVVMPSDHEGLPMTALECLALGVPLVAHNTGGLHELLEERPDYLVDDHSAEGYAKQLLAVLDDQDQPGSLGAEYLASTNAEKALGLYRALLSSPDLRLDWQKAD
jgi:glycosyltransferase involved in cell wall biosynthesis